MKCGACARSVRKTQRAIVLTGPGVMRPGRVCAACARTGWLLVFGEPAEAPKKKNTRRSKSELVRSLIDERETQEERTTHDHP